MFLYDIDLFEQVRSRNCYYVDKTDFWQYGEKVVRGKNSGTGVRL